MESFCTFFFTPFLELNLLLENNSVEESKQSQSLNMEEIGDFVKA